MSRISLQNVTVFGARARAFVTAFETELVMPSFLYIGTTAFVPPEWWLVLQFVQVNHLISQSDVSQVSVQTLFFSRRMLNNAVRHDCLFFFFFSVLT